MVLETDAIRGTVIITLPRRFDYDSAPSVESELKPILDQHPERVLFDFSKTDYISSAGMRVLISSTRSVTKGRGTVAFSSLCRQVEYIFEIAGFTKIFTIYQSREKALKHMNNNV